MLNFQMPTKTPSLRNAKSFPPPLVTAKTTYIPHSPKSNHYQHLYHAVIHQDLPTIRSLLSSNITWHNPLEHTINCALFKAALFDSADILAALLTSQNYNINAADNLGRTALHLFILYGHNLDCFRMLMDAGADVNMQDADGNTPLHFALNEEYYECVDMIVKRKELVPDVKNNKGKVPIELLKEETVSKSDKMAVKGVENKAYFVVFIVVRICEYNRVLLEVGSSSKTNACVYGCV